VHDSDMTHKSGKITKRGRWEIRAVMVQAVNMAVQHHPKWKAEFEKKKAHLGYQRAIVFFARKLLVAVWHVLTEKTPDHFAEPDLVANKMMAHAYRLSKQRRAENQKPAEYVRERLDRLGLGSDLKAFTYCGRKVVLPPSQLKERVVL
jgi:transposase